jgi:hypothetical protein
VNELKQEIVHEIFQQHNPYQMQLD